MSVFSQSQQRQLPLKPVEPEKPKLSLQTQPLAQPRRPFTVDLGPDAEPRDDRLPSHDIVPTGGLGLNPDTDMFGNPRGLSGDDPDIETKANENRRRELERRASRSPEIDMVLKRSPRLRDAYYGDERFADRFLEDERFRDHFIERHLDDSGEDTPMSYGRTQGEGDFTEYFERVM